MASVAEEMCIGCGICVEEFPVDAIVMENEVSAIDMSDCIHSGSCHDVCDQEAVRHDSEKAPDEVKANVEQAKYFMEACEEYLGGAKEQQKCLSRMIKHFNKEKMVPEKTME